MGKSSTKCCVHVIHLV